MKRLIIVVLVLLMAVPVLDARRRRPKAGDIVNDTLYVDGKYDFQMKIHKNWDAKVGRKGDPIRLVLTQKNWEAPPRYQRVQDYTAIPRLLVFVDTVSMGEFAFLDSLYSESYESDQKNAITDEIEYRHDVDVSDIIPKGRNRIELGDGEGMMHVVEAKYVKEIQTSAGSTGGRRVYGSYGGAMIVSKKDNKMLVFHVRAEEEYLQPVMEEVTMMLKSFDWTGDGGGDEE